MLISFSGLIYSSCQVTVWVCEMHFPSQGVKLWGFYCLENLSRQLCVWPRPAHHCCLLFQPHPNCWQYPPIFTVLLPSFETLYWFFQDHTSPPSRPLLLLREAFPLPRPPWAVAVSCVWCSVTRSSQAESQHYAGISRSLGKPSTSTAAIYHVLEALASELDKYGIRRTTLFTGRVLSLESPRSSDNKIIRLWWWA